MYDMLYDHLIAVIYAGELKRRRLEKKHSVKTIADPKAFGLRLSAAMPIKFQVGHQSFQLDSILNFIDVANGVQRSLEAGSSWNNQEIDAIHSAILKLISIGFSQDAIAVITGYSEQKRLLTERAKANGWSGVRQIMTIDSSQGDEYKVIFASLVTTRNLPGFMGTRYRACVGTSRQMEALYFVGRADYWFTGTEGGFKFPHDILKHIRFNRQAWNQPPFIVGRLWHPHFLSQTPRLPPSPPTREAKGKGKGVDIPITQDPVTVPASERLKSFAKETDERRRAENVAFEAEIAAVESKFTALAAAEKAKLEEEHVEALRQLEQDIAAQQRRVAI